MCAPPSPFRSISPKQFSPMYGFRLHLGQLQNSWYYVRSNRSAKNRHYETRNNDWFESFVPFVCRLFVRSKNKIRSCIVFSKTLSWIPVFVSLEQATNNSHTIYPSHSAIPSPSTRRTHRKMCCLCSDDEGLWGIPIWGWILIRCLKCDYCRSWSRDEEPQWVIPNSPFGFDLTICDRWYPGELEPRRLGLPSPPAFDGEGRTESFPPAYDTQRRTESLPPAYDTQRRTDSLPPAYDTQRRTDSIPPPYSLQDPSPNPNAQPGMREPMSYGRQEPSGQSSRSWVQLVNIFCHLYALKLTRV